MKCPMCSKDTFVTDSRETVNNNIRRRRKCVPCNTKFTTYESIDNPRLVMAKEMKRKISLAMFKAIKQVDVL
jgi:transcriptional repressor NrdR